MIIGFKEPDQLIYHYTRMAVAKDLILKNGTLRMGNLRQANDPKESKTWEFNLSTYENRNLSSYKQSDLSKRLSDKFKDHARVISFCRDVGPLTGDHLQEIAQRGFAKPRMWAQYSGLHSGVCLVFDRERLTRHVTTACAGAIHLYAGNITYRDRTIAPNLDEGDYFINIDHLERHGFDAYWKFHLHAYRGRLLFEKMQDWKDEREFRFVAVFEDAREVYINYQDGLIGVVFGDSAVEKDVEEIIQMLLPTKVEFMGLRWKNCSPWYDFGNFRYDRKLRTNPHFQETLRRQSV